MTDENYNILLEASFSTGLPMNNVLTLFSLLMKNGKIENAELVQKTGASRHCLNKIKKDLANLFEPSSPFTSLSEYGRRAVEGLDKFVVNDGFFPKIDDRQVQSIDSVLEKYNHFFPKPKRNLDQFTATHETVARRVRLMNDLADIKGKRMLFLGDDDRVSVATALVKEALKIQVLDIDVQILSGIEKIAREESLLISTSEYNTFDVFPEEHREQYDVVFTDPPYTEEGIALFLSRAIQALDKKNLSARIYFCYGNSDMAKERFLLIYKQVVEMGLMMRWVIDKFNRYRGADSIGCSSTLFVCDITPKTIAKIKGKYNGNIYTNN